MNDELFGLGEQVARNSFIHDGHFRRFIVKEELELNLIESGFRLMYSEENRGFAPFKNSDPPIIRIIASKIGGD